MSLWENLFGPVLTFFTGAKGAETAISPPPESNNTPSGNMYGDSASMWGNDSKWEKRVEESTPPSSDLGL